MEQSSELAVDTPRRTTQGTSATNPTYGKKCRVFMASIFMITTVVTEPLSKPRKLGDTNSVLPSLVGLMMTLSDSAGTALDNELVHAPTYELPRQFQLLMELTASIAGSITSVETIDQDSVLQDVERLMHAFSSSAEYLGSILRILGENRGQQQYVKAPIQKLSQLINQQFKAPINKIKHEGFTLGWLSITHDGQAPVHGFAVNGLIDRKTFGSANSRFPKAIAEGYSFSLFLRRAIETSYELCEVVDSAVRFLYRDELCQKNISPSPQGLIALASTIAQKLSYIPFSEFPNEHMARVPELSIEGECLLIVRTRLLRFPKGPYSVSSQLIARQGYTFKLPYWVR